MTEELTRGQMQDEIWKKAYNDSAYRDELFGNPKKILSKELGKDLPGDMEVEIIEEKSNVICLVAPPKPIKVGEEIADEYLDKVAGGFLDNKTENCQAQAMLFFASKIEAGGIF